MRQLRKSVLTCFLAFASHWAVAQQTALVATWATGPQAGGANPAELLDKIEGQTVRERARLSAGGAQISIRLSNEFGSTPLLIGSATIATPTDSASVKPDSIRILTFGGRTSITIPAGAPALSDPVAFPVSPGTEVSVSLYFPQRVATPTVHLLALKQAVVSPRGDQTMAKTIEGATTLSSIALSAVLVPAQPAQRLVVAFGDSLVDGDQSSVDADRNWPDDLIRRLGKTPGGSKVAVINEGIIVNRLLGDAFGGVNGLARFDRDALAMPGVTHVVLLEGINDIGFPGAKLGGSYLADPADLLSAEDVIQAYRQLIFRAHARGVKLIGATMTPCEGVVIPGYYSETKDAVRQEVNKWIRTSATLTASLTSMRFYAIQIAPVDCCRALLPRMVSIPMTRDIRSWRMQSISIYFGRFDSAFIASVLAGFI